MKKLKSRYKRVVLKLSGEALQGEQGFGIDPAVTRSIARELKDVSELEVQIAVVIGGGNIFRGSSVAGAGFERSTADYMGMLATVINAMALQNALEQEGVHTRVLSAIEMRAVAEPFIRRRAIRHLEKGRIVIFAGGTGNPFFTTDTAAALRANEIGADVILKATQVNGVYSDDPQRNHRAKLYSRLKYIQVLKRGLKVMDATSVSLCMDNGIPIVVFNLHQKGNIKRVLSGERVGTLVTA